MKHSSIPAKKTPVSTQVRVLGFVVIVFFIAWIVVGSLLFLLDAKWPAFVGSGILFGGFIISWIITVSVLKHKNPKYVEALLSDDLDEQKADGKKN